MHWSLDTAQKRMAELNMNDIPLVQRRPIVTNVAPDWFVQYKKLSHDFLKSLADSVDTLAFLNLTQDEFMGIIMGTRVPENLSLRFRVPLVWGGALDINNIFMCQTFPHAHNMDMFIIEQDGNDLIWLPNPAKKVYVPAHTAGGGDGGNATEDRMSQLAAQMAAQSYGME